jgi:hypothetical protein
MLFGLIHRGIFGRGGGKLRKSGVAAPDFHTLEYP